MKHLLIEIMGITLIGCAAFLAVVPCALMGVAFADDGAMRGSARAHGLPAEDRPVCIGTRGSPGKRPLSGLGQPVLGVYKGAGDRVDDSWDRPRPLLYTSANRSASGGSGSDKSEGRRSGQVSGFKPRFKIGGGYLWFKPDFGFMNSGAQEFAFSQTEYQSRSGGGFGDMSAEFEIVTRTRGSLGLCLRTFYHRESLKDGDTDIDMEWLSARIGLALSVPVARAGMISETGVRWSSCLLGFNRIEVTGLPVQNSLYRWWWRDREIPHQDRKWTSYTGHVEAGWYFIVMRAVELNVYGLTDWGTGFASWGVGVRTNLLLGGF